MLRKNVQVYLLLGAGMVASHVSFANELSSKHLTLRQKIGQMVMVPYSGQFVNENSEFRSRLNRFVVDEGVGGLILYGGSPVAMAQLTNELQKLARIPLLIAADVEYGVAHQLSNSKYFYDHGGLLSGPLHQGTFRRPQYFQRIWRLEPPEVHRLRNMQAQ